MTSRAINGEHHLVCCNPTCWVDKDEKDMDCTVLESRKLLGDALQAVSGNDRYNEKHSYETAFPNGAADHIRMLMENIIRLDATNDRDKAVDYLGYAALYLAWIREGCPKSKFSYIAERYINLFRIQERQVELSEMREHEDNTNGDGCGALPQLSD